MTKDNLLNKIPWLWIAVIILSILVILQYVQILKLRKTLWYTFAGVAAEARVRTIIDARTSLSP